MARKDKDIPRETPVVGSVMIFADLQDMYRSWNLLYVQKECQKRKKKRVRYVMRRMLLPCMFQCIRSRGEKEPLRSGNMHGMARYRTRSSREKQSRSKRTCFDESVSLTTSMNSVTSGDRSPTNTENS